MNIKELMPIVNTGKSILVEITSDEIGYFCCLDVGMRATITKITYSDDSYCCLLDCTEFEKYNEQFMQSNYYDKNNEPVLNAKEAGYWQNKNKIYVEEETDYFKIVSKWLENELLKSRDLK